MLRSGYISKDKSLDGFKITDIYMANACLNCLLPLKDLNLKLKSVSRDRNRCLKFIETSCCSV